MEELNDILYYLKTHNKNYTNKQYNYILDLETLINEDYYYLCYVLGYDLLHNEYKKIKTTECDITWEISKKIINEFLQSEELQNTNLSTYDALQEFLRNNKKLINKIIKE